MQATPTARFPLARSLAPGQDERRLNGGRILSEKTPSRLKRAGARVTRPFAVASRWLRDHYLKVALPLGFAFYLLALIYFGLGIREAAVELLPALADLSRALPDRRYAPEVAESIRNLAYALAALLGALAVLAMVPFRLIKAWVEERTALAAEQGLITSRITQAVEQLGAEKTVKLVEETPRYLKRNDKWVIRHGKPVRLVGPDGKPIVDRESHERTQPNLEVRLGALYALERIAQDSLRDHVPIMETLCAYIRENSVNLEEPARPRIDILTALTILGRRGPDQRAQEAKRTPPYRPDLGGAKFGRNDLSGLSFQGMLFIRAQLTNADLSFTDMRGANLRVANLDDAQFRETRFTGARLDWSSVQKVNIEETDMSDAYLRNASFNFTELGEVNLSGSGLQARKGATRIRISQAQAMDFFADGSVIFPKNIDFPRPKHWCDKKLDEEAFLSRWRDWREQRDLPWPPPGEALAYLADHPATPFDSLVQPHEIDQVWDFLSQ